MIRRGRELYLYAPPKLFGSNLEYKVSEMYSCYKQQQILHYNRMGHKAPTICHLLWKEGLKVSRVISLHKFLKKYRETGSINRSAGSGRPTKTTAAVKEHVERQMWGDDKTTAVQLYALLARNGHHMTLKTVLQFGPFLGWAFWRSTYCQVFVNCVQDPVRS